MSEKKEKRPQQVFTLLVQVGRKAGDGLPEDCSGAGLMIYASGVDEAEAVRHPPPRKHSRARAALKRGESTDAHPRVTPRRTLATPTCSLRPRACR